ncbi:C39 family peptidase [Xenorhabdus bovienii]|uniref:C39 family peptidase n=1 Tax=Xenorhabdus bovienii TaxID=40576 RepID=UPI0023B2DF49|nr:C39 family peptidase [Xenorhabdus bovienii]MDE9537063.1 C39 family peptidase [Xenorhabdus bovienii]MDE9587357.1 C39 family peptidase [Xenorhabdus bovienii]
MTTNRLAFPQNYPRTYEIPGFRKSFQRQEKNNWCWIATTAAVTNYYTTTMGLKNKIHWKQCELYDQCVSNSYNNSSCSFPGDNSIHNRTGNPEVAMNHTFIFREKSRYIATGPVLDAVDRNTPPIVGFHFYSTDSTRVIGQHVVTIFGYQEDGKWLIADPNEEKVQCFTPEQLQKMGIFLAEVFYSMPPPFQ